MSEERLCNRVNEIAPNCDNITVIDGFNISAEAIKQDICFLNGHCIVFIDYWQLLDSSLKIQLKSLAQELQIHILTAFQLPRNVEDNPEGRATLKNLFERITETLFISDEDFDTIMFLWRTHKCDRGIGTATAIQYQVGFQVL